LAKWGSKGLISIENVFFCPKIPKLLMYNKRNISKEVMVLNFAIFVKGGRSVFIHH